LQVPIYKYPLVLKDLIREGRIYKARDTWHFPTFTKNLVILFLLQYLAKLDRKRN